MEETFTQMLLRFMAERKITRAGLYKDADIDRKLIYKILKRTTSQRKGLRYGLRWGCGFPWKKRKHCWKLPATHYPAAFKKTV